MGLYFGRQAISFHSGTDRDLSAELTEQKEKIQNIEELVNSKAAPIVTITEDEVGNITINGLSVTVDEDGNATFNLGE